MQHCLAKLGDFWEFRPFELKRLNNVPLKIAGSNIRRSAKCLKTGKQPKQIAAAF